MWRTLPHLRLSFGAIVCCTLLNCGAAGIVAEDNVWEDLLPEPRLVDAPLIAGPLRLAISFDGKRLAIAGTAERATLWGQQRVNEPCGVAYLCEADTGKQIALLQLGGAGRERIDLAFSPDGKSLATLGAGAVHLWDPTTGRDQLTLPALASPSVDGGISFSPNSKLLAASCGYSAVEIWDVAAQKKSQTISVDYKSASAFPDDASLLTAEYGNRLHLWNLADGQQLGELHPMMGILYSVDISADRKLAAVAGGGFKLLDISSKAPRLRERSVLNGQIGEGGSVSFARKENLLATAGMEGTVRLWDPRNGMLVGLLWWPYERLENCAPAAVLSPDGALVVVSRWLCPADGPTKCITEIYPVAELTKPDRITRIVLAAAESLFVATEPDQNRRRLSPRALGIALSVLHGPHAEPAVPMLIAKLKNERVDVRLTALRGLACIGPGAKQAVPAILALRDDKSQNVQRAARFAIAKIEGR